MLETSPCVLLMAKPRAVGPRAEGTSSPERLFNASSPQALCVNAKPQAERCPHGAQAAKRPEWPEGPSSPLPGEFHR